MAGSFSTRHLLLHYHASTRFQSWDEISDFVVPQVHGSCLEACQSAAQEFADLQALTDRCRLLARCLFFRQLLARAVAAEAASLLPEAAAALEAAAITARGPHVCDIVDLPRPQGSEVVVHICQASLPIINAILCLPVYHLSIDWHIALLDINAALAM